MHNKFRMLLIQSHPYDLALYSGTLYEEFLGTNTKSAHEYPAS